MLLLIGVDQMVDIKRDTMPFLFMKLNNVNDFSYSLDIDMSNLW